MSALSDILGMVVRAIPKQAAGKAGSRTGLKSLEDAVENVLLKEGDEAASRVLQQEGKRIAGQVEEGLDVIPKKLEYPQPKQGWWQDELSEKGTVTLYHGADESRLQSIFQKGLMPDERGKTFVTPDVDTGFGYASMTGGEKTFRKAGAKARHNPEENRAVLHLEIPKDFIEKYLSPNQTSKLSVDKLFSPQARESFQPYDFKNNQPYYALTEISFDAPIPPEFIVGYSKKAVKKGTVKKETGGSLISRNPYSITTRKRRRD
jgi:hypothetical protein